VFGKEMRVAIKADIPNTGIGFFYNNKQHEW
jgi:hypothetical protein